ncbi:hypothetical protein F5J12DRAFT_438672 [Pisolithus orientalis]|uniref:uncharacterized protein n=1 Tax=Pisolithus orientalis TaxID=936130 RepID=UPI0022258C6B|nr:uncharacterized protein F5J12DRAFT_438672 [Pisolithus orientalis]KAI6025571.1 hypothetical protein F5J12DRAFT_438672 [Pisolithus orientalis]
MAFVGIVFGMLFGILLSNGSRMGMMCCFCNLICVSECCTQLGAPFPIIFFSFISGPVVFMEGQKGVSVGESVTTLCALRAILGFFVGIIHTSGSAFRSEMEQDGIAKNAQYQWLVLGTSEQCLWPTNWCPC